MPLTPLQTAQNNWKRRANVFASHGIAPEYYSQLYNRDMEGVFSGKTGMSDAEIFTAVQSSVGGASISDPKAMHGTGSVFSGIADTLGNIGHDISGIITGFPGAIAHTVAHAPSEVTNTFELIDHIANSDNTWLKAHGYLQAGDHLNDSWGDFATILRAMGSQGSKQLLPYLPFITDLAGVTNGAGRASLMQHPVGAMLDVLPGLVKVGKLSVAGRDFTEAERVAGKPSPRFYAAGRALQQGNPIKAVVSAVGDIVPAGKDDFGASMTLRARANLVGKTFGLDKLTRESIVRPFSEARDSLEYNANTFIKEKFGDNFLAQATPERMHYIYLGAHGINPDTGEVFRSVDEALTWENTQLSDVERAGMTVARNVVAEVEAHDQAVGARDWVPSPDGLWKDMYSTKSPVYKAWQQMLKANDKMQAAQDRGDTEALMGHRAKWIEAVNKFYESRFKEIPEAWNPAIAHFIRQGAIDKVKTLMQGQELDQAIKQIRTSVWGNEYERLLGKEGYNALVGDAVRWWQGMASAGYVPLWTEHVDPSAVESVLNPGLGRLDKPTEPSRFRPKAEGIYFGESVHNIALSLTEAQTEIMRQQMVASVLRTHIIPKFTVNKGAKIREYADAIMSARNGGGYHPEARVHQLIKENYEDFDPQAFGVRPVDLGMKNNSVKLLLDKDAAKALHAMMDPNRFREMGKNWFHKGTSLYKFSVLTGPRHLAHVTFGGMMFMMGREPLAPIHFLRASKIIRGVASPEDHGLAGGMLSGLRGKVYQIGPHHHWSVATGAQYGQDLATDWIHQAGRAGKTAAEYIPNKLARLEETVMDMYRVSTYLSAKARGLNHDTALELAHKVFVDINGLSLMERTAIKQIFPFYAFTRHLFRYLFQYPVDYPLRAAIVAQFGEGEQQDWHSGLPRSYMSLFHIGHTDKNGNIVAIDLKNLNPFRSFANDFSFAGFFSSLSPWLSGPLTAVGVDTLSGTTQLYPGTTYNPQTGTLQATPPPGGMLSLTEAFVPQIGLLDHFLQLTSSTRYLAKYSPLSYRKQMYNMLNVPFVPEVINVPYQQEITEMRRFRAAQAAVTLLEQQPTKENVAKAMQWNLVPWNNQLISPAALAAYYQRVQAALQKAGRGQISPKAVTVAPPRRPAALQNF